MANISNDKDRGKFEGIQDHRVMFDQTTMWNRIQKKKRKRRFFIWLFMGFGILVMTGLLLQWNNTQTGIYVSTDKSEGVSSGNDKIASGDSFNNPITRESSINKDKSINTPATISNKEHADYNRPNEQLPGSEIESANEENRGSVFNQRLPILEPNTKQFQDESDVYPISTRVKQSSPSTKTKPSTLPSLPSPNNRVPERIINKTLPISTLRILPEFLQTNSNHISLNPELSLMDTKSPIWSFFLFGEYGQVARTLDGTQMDLINHRILTEETLEQIGFGLDMKASISKRLYIGTGVHYSMINSEMKYQNSRVTTIGDLDPSMIPSILMGQEGIVKIVNNSTYYNSYNSWSLPLNIGIKFPSSNFDISIEGGVNFYFSQNYNGHVSDEHQTLFRTESLDIKYSRLGYSGGIVFSQKIGPMKVIISPKLTVVPTYNLLDINEMNKTLSLRIGLGL